MVTSCLPIIANIRTVAVAYTHRVPAACHRYHNVTNGGRCIYSKK